MFTIPLSLLLPFFFSLTSHCWLIWHLLHLSWALYESNSEILTHYIIILASSISSFPHCLLALLPQWHVSIRCNHIFHLIKPLSQSEQNLNLSPWLLADRPLLPSNFLYSGACPLPTRFGISLFLKQKGGSFSTQIFSLECSLCQECFPNITFLLHHSILCSKVFPDY